MTKSIALIYRSTKNKRFSIENVFSELENNPVVEKIVLPVDLTSIKNFFILLLFSLKIKQKIIHISGDVHYIAIFLFWKKCIITVHDLNHFENLVGLKKYIYGLIWFYLPLKLAESVIAISPYTKNQLLKHFAVKESKIKVIPNSFVNFKGAPPIEKKFKNQYQILFIGRNLNKNIKRLIVALQNIPDIHLRIIGEQPTVITKILINSNICFSVTSNLSREELANEYKNSNLLFFASTKEGFGLPILEAQSLGIPVITSNTTSMPYVAGNAAVLVNPYSTESIKNAILLFAQNRIDIDDLKKKGLINIERFSEKKFIESYVQLYNNV